MMEQLKASMAADKNKPKKEVKSKVVTEIVAPSKASTVADENTGERLALYYVCGDPFFSSSLYEDQMTFPIE